MVIWVRAETPVSWVGAAGFSPAQRAFIDACLLRVQGPATWRMCRFGRADAWLVNGEKCELLRNGNLRISSGSSSEASLQAAKSVHAHGADAPGVSRLDSRRRALRLASASVPEFALDVMFIANYAFATSKRYSVVSIHEADPDVVEE